MITLLEINKAIIDKITLALAGTDFSTVSLVAEDVTEPILRPSLKVSIENSANGKFNSQCREKTLTIRVYFFAKDRYEYKIDNAKMQDLLENAFLEDLYVCGAYIPIQIVETEVVDTVMVLSFDLYLVELLPDTDTSEPMEVIKYKEGTI